MTKIASFDVFDTLLTRAFGSPLSGAILLGKKVKDLSLSQYTPEAFARARIDAQMRAFRNAGGIDSLVNLRQIYAELGNALGLTQMQRDELMNLELELEAELIRPVPLAKELVQAARDRNQRIVFVSDMYIGTEFIQKQLTHHGLYLDGDRCYVSCDYGKSKVSGELFRELLHQEGIAPNLVSHCGDDLWSDIRSAKRIGLKVTPFLNAKLNRYEEILDSYSWATEGLSSAMAGVSSTFSAFQLPAYAAATTLLVPKQHLGRASGMVQTTDAISRLISPILAGVLVVTIQIQGVILIDFLTFVFAAIALLLVRFPKPKITVEAQVEKGLLHEAIYGWTYISTRRGLLGLLMFFTISNFLIGIVSVLFTPLVLSFTSATVLGTMFSIGGVGMLLGGLMMSAWGGLKHRIYSVLGFTLLNGLCILLGGLQPSVPVFFVAAFIYFFGVAVINSSDQAIWQSKVPLAVQGRVFAMRTMLAWASTPLAYLMAGPLADQVFEPLLTVGGPLAGSIGRIIGVGKGHGIALLFVAIAILMILMVVGGYLYLPLRLLEDQLPDAILDDASHTEENER